LLRGIEREVFFKEEEEEEEESPGLPFLLLRLGFQLSTLFCRTAYLFASLAGAFFPQMYMLFANSFYNSICFQISFSLTNGAISDHDCAALNVKISSEDGSLSSLNSLSQMVCFLKLCLQEHDV
jgi:hypothetical protein